MSERRQIRFLMALGPHGWLSNLSPHPFEAEGRRWPHVEAYYQAAKFPHDPERQERIRRMPGPLAGKRIAYEADARPRPDWDEVKIEVLRRGQALKFRQHPELIERLLATGDAELVEHTRRDGFWGDAGDGSGLNWCGRLLMELRDTLRAERQA